MDAATKARAKAQDIQFLQGDGRTMQVVCMKTYERSGTGGPASFGFLQRNPLGIHVRDLSTDTIRGFEGFSTLDALLDVWMVD